MTDLVSQLVGALEFYADPLRYSGPNQRSVPGDKHTPDGAPYMVDVTRDGGQIAQAALTAAKAGGWVAVPVEPTPEMVENGTLCVGQTGAITRSIYAAMLAARPTTPPKEQA